MNRILALCFYSTSLVFGLPPTCPLLSQENIRNIEEPGRFTKYLTPASMDRWTFRGRKDETILVEVTTQEFDAVLSLLQVEDNSKESILHQVDDEGSNCRLAFRLPADGEYKIGVTGFEQKGGGNYSLSLQKFLAREIQIDQLTTDEYDSKGQAFYYFSSAGDQYLTIDSPARNGAGQCILLDARGAPLNPAGSLYELKAAGEYRLRVSGRRLQPFQIHLKPAVRDALPDTAERTLQLESREAVVLDYAGSVGKFRLLELNAENEVYSQFLFASLRKPEERSLDGETQRPELSLLSKFEKGYRKHYAVLLGREDRYQLRLYSPQGGQVELRISDPTQKLVEGTSRNDRLSVGGTRFYQIQPKPGQTTTLRVSTEQFDPFIQLFDDQGQLIDSNDDEAGAGLNCYLRHTSYSDANLLLAVKSVGDGGGGEFNLTMRAEAPQALGLGETKTRVVGNGGSDLWLFSAQAGQQVIFYCQSPSQMRMILKNAQGIPERQVSSDADSDGAVMLVKFPSSGDFSIEIISPAGENYTLQAIGTD